MPQLLAVLAGLVFVAIAVILFVELLRRIDSE